MSLLRYLPSAKFTVIVGSLFLSAGLIYAADWATSDHTPNTASLQAQNTPSDAADWEATLFEIQAQNAETALTPPDQNTVSTLLQAAQSNNVTDTVGKTLLINLTNAGSQGLGSDIPTQNQIIDAAMTQLQRTPVKTYTSADLMPVPKTSESSHTYGNAFMRTVNAYPAANVQQVLIAVGYAAENNDPSKLATLKSAADAYKNIAQDLAKLPVPQTLVPFHLTAVNDFARISNTLADMQTIVNDPLRGLSGLQTYEALLSEANRVFTNIAQNLNKDGILFTNDEPGVAWKSFLTSP